MKIAIIGRTQMLVDVAEHLASCGHEIAAVVTVPEDADVQSLAKRHSAALVLTRRISEASTIDQIITAGCEIGVSLNWVSLVSESTIAHFKHGVLNGHGGDLPRYRGNACQNWAILRGEPKIGLCVHAMERELDAGPVYQRKYFALSDQTYIGDVYDWFGQVLPEMFADSLAMIERGEQPIQQEQYPGGALRSYPRRPEDSKIKWKSDDVDLSRLVRASSKPFDGAYCFLEDGRRVTIWRASVFKPLGGHVAMPGQPCTPIDGDPMIACGRGFLRLEEVEIEGLSASEAKREINKSVRRRLV